MKIDYELKIHPQYFNDIMHRDKRHEIRRNKDRKFNVGDVVLLREYCPGSEVYTGFETIIKITYVSPIGKTGVPEWLTIFSFEVIE